MAQMTMIQAITDALRVEMKNDPNVLVFGEDVGVNGGVFRATEGLQAEFGEDRNGYSTCRVWYWWTCSWSCT